MTSATPMMSGQRKKKCKPNAFKQPTFATFAHFKPHFNRRQRQCQAARRPMLLTNER